MIQALRAQDLMLIDPVTMTNTATQTANFDTLDPGQGRAGWATIRIGFSSELNTNAVGPTITLSESDDTVVTNFATISANRTNEDLAAAKELRYEIDLRGRKRYLRLSVTTATATNDNVTVCAIGTLTRLGGTQGSPASTTEMGDDVVVQV